jgi:4-amino-4-deoxy-L-arabinose transferase-like glycosyltransferase
MDPITNSGKISRNSLYLIIGFSLFELLLHLYTNAFASYGYFRDELYYAACSNHLAAGYVDHPPLSIYLLFISIHLFGKSLFALRLFPAIASGIVVFITGLITRKLNGGYLAIILACISVALIPEFLGTASIYSMNAYDWLFWVLAYYLVILIIKSPLTEYNHNKKLWILLGLVLGLGLLNKIDLLWFGFALLIGLILTPQRVHLKTIWPYLAGLIAFAIFSPYIYWNITHNYATLEFIHRASVLKYSSLNPGIFIKNTILTLNPISAIIWIAGIYFLFFHKDGKDYRLTGYIFLVTFIILIINYHSKAEYIAPAFPLLFAAGGVMFEKITVK